MARRIPHAGLEFARSHTGFQGELGRAVAASSGYVMAGTMQAVARAIREAEGKVTGTAREFARLIEDGMLTPQERQRIHQDVGRTAQRAVVNSYAQSFGPSKQRSEPGYRADGASKYRRYAGGRLRAALGDPEFFRATPDDLQFINTRLLDKRAKQWARLNYGAGERGTGSRPAQQVFFGDMVVGAFGLNEGARPGFTIPRGYFVQGGGGSSFYVAGTGPSARFENKNKVKGRSASRYATVTSDQGLERRQLSQRRGRADDNLKWIRGGPTKGIKGRNFLDAGVAQIADRQDGLFPRYERAMGEAIKRGESSLKRMGRNQTIKSVPARPRLR